MKVLITGAGGFVGKRLTRRLAGDGHEVFALMREPPAGPDAEFFKPAGVTVIRQDLTTLDVSALPGGIEAVITLAQSSRFRDFPSQAEEVFAVNVTANLQILQWAVAAGVKRFVHASSGGIYGGKRGGQFLETDLLAVDSPLGFYLGSKLCSEVVLQNYRNFFETMAILRPFFIFGPGQRSDMFVSRIIESVRLGRPISLQGKDGLRMNPIFVEDAVTAFQRAIGLGGHHVVNVAGSDILSLRQMSELIGAELHRTPVFESRPGEVVDYVADIEFSRQGLGLRPRGFADGLRETLASR